MYQSFYRLNKKPFQINVDPDFLWMGEKHKEALAMLKYGVMDNRGFIMLTGDVGTGKTTLVNALTSNLGRDVVVASITNPGLKQMDFLNHLATAFKLGKKYFGKGDFLLDFTAFLEKCHRDGKQVLLIIDEAQRLNKNMLEEIRLLSNIELQNIKLLNIFFVGQDEFNEILDLYENRALRQRMTLQYHLMPLSENETRHFIKHRLKVAGTEKSIFTLNSIKEIYEFSGGYPRLINIICDHAMIAGYAANRKVIDALEVKSCAKDLKLPSNINSSKNNKNKKVEISTIRPEPQEGGLFPHRYSYTALFFFITLLACFFYFPFRAGSSFSGVLDYWFGDTQRVEGQRSDVGGQPVLRSSPATEDGRSEDGDEETKRLGSLKAGMLGGQRSEVEEQRSEDGPSSAVAMLRRVEGQRAEDETEFSVLHQASEVASEDEPFQLSPEENIESGRSGVEDESFLDQRPGSLAVQPSGDVASQHSIPESEKKYILAFEFDSNDLSQDGYERLDRTAYFMKSDPGINLMVKGYTDTSGEYAYNIMLSKFRADIVKNYLVTKGIAPEKITTVGKGGMDPIADNESYDGRRANRRVEVEMGFE